MYVSGKIFWIFDYSFNRQYSVAVLETTKRSTVFHCWNNISTIFLSNAKPPLGALCAVYKMPINKVECPLADPLLPLNSVFFHRHCAVYIFQSTGKQLEDRKNRGFWQRCKWRDALFHVYFAKNNWSFKYTNNRTGWKFPQHFICSGKLEFCTIRLL